MSSKQPDAHTASRKLPPDSRGTSALTMFSVCDKVPMLPERPGMLMSGGQTGVDRAALDWAIANDINHGGWCPAGRLAADGVIDERYGLTETESTGYRQRTKRNVADSDATLIIYRGVLEGGSLSTQVFAEKQRKPCLVLNLDFPTEQLLTQWLAWSTSHRPARLNVAGPSEFRCPGIYRQARTLLDLLLLHPGSYGEQREPINSES